MELAQHQTQKQTLSQAQRQSLQVLQMPLTELGAYLQEQVLANPLLDLELPPTASLPDAAPDPSPLQEEDDRWDLAYSESSGAWDAAPGAPADGCADLLPSSAQGETLTDAIHEQLLSMQHLTPRLRALCLYLAECLDENGFLPFSLAELAAEQHTSLFEMEQALYVLQSLQPAGVGARGLEECLVLQLARTPHFSALTLHLVQRGLPLLARNDLPGLAALLGCTEAQAAQAAQAVRGLSPRPSRGYGAGGFTAYQVPEAVFYLSGTAVRAALNRRSLPRLSVNEEACALLRGSDAPDACAYLREQLAAANGLMRSVQEREGTLRRLLELAARAQEGFFLRREAPRAFTLTQAAGELGLSLSTVSRAVQGKTVQFERRCFPLRALFPAALAAEGEVSGEQVRRRLQSFVSAESKAHPLSDEALRAALSAVHLPVSRRTVAKYREELGIPASHLRRV